MPKPKKKYPPWHDLGFTPGRKKSGLRGGGRVHAEVFLGDKWHTIAIEMDGEGFKKLSALPERSRMLLLDSLACVPVHSNSLSLTGKKKRPRGTNSKSSLTAWHTARTLGPPLFRWLQQAAEDPNDRTYKVVLEAMKEDGLTDASPETATAYLLERNWLNAYRLNPQRFPKWTSSATSKPKNLLKQIIPPGSEHKGVLPDYPETFIANILSGDDARKVYVLSNNEIESTSPMADFRIY